MSVKYDTQYNWQKANTTIYAVRINHNTDSDIQSHLEEIKKTQSIMSYIKSLIRRDMEAQNTAK